MSWIQGIIGENVSTIKERFAFSSQHLSSLEVQGKFFIQSGGNADTLHTVQNNNFVAVVAGIGLKRSTISTHILSSEEWKTLLEKEKPDFSNLNGHFIAVRYRNQILECFSDKVGLRTLYFGLTEHGWVFSTKLHWVCQHIPQSTIDWKIFGSKWLCLQQFSFESPITSTSKLPPNSCATIADNKLTITSRPWLSIVPNSEHKANSISILQSLISVEEREMKLGMSGGLDSRVLFSLLLSNKKSFSTYAFGDNKNPDVVLARLISESKSIAFNNILKEIPSVDECIKLLREYISQSNLVEGASSSVRLRHYRELHESRTIIIDGGNGEIARRQFLQRLLFKGKKDLFHLQSEKIFPHVRLHRADIFNNDIMSIMHHSALHELEISLQSIPSPKEIGIENFLDLWTVKTRIPLVASDEQARIDESIINFMPYSQPDYIQSVLNLPIQLRKNNTLYKRIIAQYSPSLSNFPLVKNYILYPYHLSTLQSRIWTKAKLLLLPQFQEPTLHQFLEAMKEYVIDTLESQSTKNYTPYNYNKISKVVKSYYDGDKQYASEVNWWLAFDEWRKLVEK